MLTKDEIKQAIKFQEAIADVVDAYLREGMSEDIIVEVLESEAGIDFHARRLELEART